MSKWKNKDGKTVHRNSVAEYFTSRPVELVTSPAFRVLSLSAHRALARIELELREHAGNGNGKLIVTKEQFIDYGLHQDAIAPALRELDALGIAIITVHGRGGNAEHKQPNRFLLNYMCGAVDAHDLITNSWKRFKTLEEAAKVAAEGRTLMVAGITVVRIFPDHGNHAWYQTWKPCLERQNSQTWIPCLQGQTRNPCLLLIYRVGVGPAAGSI